MIIEIIFLITFNNKQENNFFIYTLVIVFLSMQMKYFSLLIYAFLSIYIIGFFLYCLFDENQKYDITNMIFLILSTILKIGFFIFQQEFFKLADEIDSGLVL